MVTVKYEVSCTKGNVVNKIVIEHCCIVRFHGQRNRNYKENVFVFSALTVMNVLFFLFCVKSWSCFLCSVRKNVGNLVNKLRSLFTILNNFLAA